MAQVHVVENDPALALLYHDELEDAGFTVRVHGDLIGLLSLADREGPQILVTDLDSVGANPDIWLPSLRNVFNGPVVALGECNTGSAHKAGLAVLPKSSNLKPLIQSIRGYVLKMAWADAFTPNC